MESSVYIEKTLMFFLKNVSALWNSINISEIYYLAEILMRIIPFKVKLFILSLLQDLKLQLSLMVMRREVKSQIRQRWFLFYRLELALREELNTDSIEGYNESEDQLLQLATDYLLYKDAFSDSYKQGTLARLDSVREFRYVAYGKNKERLEAIESEARKSPKVVKAIFDYQLFSSYMYGGYLDGDHRPYFLRESKKLDPQVEPLNKKRSKQLVSVAKKEIRESLKKIKLKHSFKIDVSSEQITTIAAVISAVLVFTGFIQNKYLLGSFGIEVSRYFTLSDYLASSIEGVSYGALAALFAIFSMFVGFQNSTSTTRLEDNQLANERKHILRLACLGSLIPVVLFFVSEPQARNYKSLYIPALLAVMYLSDFISCRYFKDPVAALFALTFFGLFATNVYITTADQIRDIEYAKGEDKKYNFTLANEDADERIIISSNSNYFFIKNITSGAVEIHKSDDVGDITVVPPSEEAGALDSWLNANKIIWSAIKGGLSG